MKKYVILSLFIPITHMEVLEPEEVNAANEYLLKS